MADVSRQAADRGQMILVAAFGIAVMLVALALILNTAIYTENLATRGSDISGGHDAVQYRDTTERMLDDTFRYVNANNNSTYTDLQSNLRFAVWNYSNASGRQQATDAIVTRTTVESRTGTHIYNRSGNFTDDSGNGNWTLVGNENAEGVRDVTIEVEPDTLSETSPPPVFSDTRFFYMNFSDPGDAEYYRIYVFNDSSGGTDVLTVNVEGQTDAGWNFKRDCTPAWNGETATVNVTGATVEGEHCEPLTHVANITSDGFNVAFNNTMDGTDPTIEGNYSMVVDSDFGDTEAAAPSRERVLYSVTAHVVYESKRLFFETDVRKAPGEFDD